MTDSRLIGMVDPPDLQVMTYNIRRRFPALRPGSPDRWGARRSLLRRILRAEQPSLLGAQEALPDQAEFVGEALGHHYEWVGRGREADGRGESCPVYFDSRRLELLEWSQQALSATPDHPGSRTWGNRVPRILVIARLRDRETGARLIALNTHFDHLSWQSRAESARRVADLAAELHRDDPAGVIVVTGDVNAGPSSTAHGLLTAGGHLRDTWEVAEHHVSPPWRTFSNYRRPRATGKRIDLVLVGPGVTVDRVGINAARFAGAAASDHEPVQAVIRRNAVTTEGTRSSTVLE